MNSAAHLFANAPTPDTVDAILSSMTSPANDLPAPCMAPARPSPGAATVDMAQLALMSGVSEADLVGLIEYGMLHPVAPEREPWCFKMSCVTILQRAESLRQDLALDAHGFALAVMLLERVTQLEAELKVVRSELSMCQTEQMLQRRSG